MTDFGSRFWNFPEESTEHTSLTTNRKQMRFYLLMRQRKEIKLETQRKRIIIDFVQFKSFILKWTLNIYTKIGSNRHVHPFKKFGKFVAHCRISDDLKNVQ